MAMPNIAGSKFSAALPIIGLVLMAAIFVVFLFYGFIKSMPQATTGLSSSYVTTSADPLVSKVQNLGQITQPILRADNYTYGNKQGNVKIFEFSDFACPYCRAMSQKLKAAADKHPEVEVVWKDFPITSLHPDSLSAHQAARCAGEQGKFWEYHDKLFQNQANLSATTELSLANGLGLKPQAFLGCLSSTGVSSSIQEDMAEGEALQIDGTPFLFVGDQRISGLLSDEELEQVIALHAQIKP